MGREYNTDDIVVYDINQLRANITIIADTVITDLKTCFADSDQGDEYRASDFFSEYCSVRWQQVSKWRRKQDLSADAFYLVMLLYLLCDDEHILGELQQLAKTGSIENLDKIISFFNNDTIAEKLRKFYVTNNQERQRLQHRLVETLRKFYETSTVPKPVDKQSTLNTSSPNGKKVKPKVTQTKSGQFNENFLSAVPLGNGVTLEMLKVRAGTFMMGSPGNEDGRFDDEKLHKVTLTQDYWLGKYPVTQAQWLAIMGNDPSHFFGGDRPVESVDWHCAKYFCVRLNKKFKDKLPSGYQFDLPTEAQWEYACRAGTTTAYFWGNTCNATKANYDGNYPRGTSCKGPYLERTTSVGSYAPNDWNFYDMHGNVWEWCRDWYGSYDGDAIDPVGPSSGSDRVIRGGSCRNYAGYCRSASRFNLNPDLRRSFLGFRLAVVPVQ